MERWEGVATENLKRQLTTKRKSEFSLLKMKLAKWSKQRIDARNTWTRSNFCADEWDNEYLDHRKDKINDCYIDYIIDYMSGKI